MPNYRGGMSHSGPSPGLGGPVLYLGNMPPGTTPEQVFELLSGYRFDRNSVRMKRAPNGQLTGDAMVAFDTPQETDRVLRELGGRTRFQGRMLISGEALVACLAFMAAFTHLSKTLTFKV
ncbi:unnamed protein product [Protopolystoma xenopodis]|uniref:RRM domain-containing protein n=1 Tax=Protopolystoma xenopodis TaxID=117903 RepID=A0A3S5AYP7_9PLAT|nr:unnamed protein product [Protopolystoma xenopodis]